ncbi:SCY1 protein kinase [Thecamonas trahens ATCC 50062]|uniref:SCY1 protein kinase n=1 Tax=Thecamonas trahens ATCC 50062 TaxID=461836 RepID=A0A0L0DNV2_THETB|nr:SCY1 protein kinase [Thecamonas trahens ATCC 50062]KNC54002.1 SCY1 protein kinase [Thecamonas trahens ATCC 50062]|eukprot:XP_013754018.1 SCY1 protein kinase [Thecamonas trahens ATCC 50062]
MGNTGSRPAGTGPQTAAASSSATTTLATTGASAAGGGRQRPGRRPLELGQVEVARNGLWRAVGGRLGGESATLFKYSLDSDGDAGGNGVAAAVQRRAVRNAAKRAKQLRHPGLVAANDVVLSNDMLVIATEHMIPLESVLAAGKLHWQEAQEGLVALADALHFLHATARLVHNNVSPATVFVSAASHAFVLVGLEFVVSPKTLQTTPFLEQTRSVRDPRARAPEDDIAANPVHNHDATLFARDAFGLGAVVRALIAAFPNTEFGNALAKIEHALRAPEPRSRPTMAMLPLRPGLSPTASPHHAPLVFLAHGAREFATLDAAAKAEFVALVPSIVEPLPASVILSRVAPLLLQPMLFVEPLTHSLIEFLFGSGPRSLASLLGDSAAFERVMLPFFAKGFDLPLRAVRLPLLRSLALAVDRLSEHGVAVLDLPLHLPRGLRDSDDAIVIASADAAVAVLLRSNGTQPWLASTFATLCHRTGNAFNDMLTALRLRIRDPDELVRVAAVTHLWSASEAVLGTVKAVEKSALLLELLLDPRAAVRDAADAALQQLRASALAPNAPRHALSAFSLDLLLAPLKRSMRQRGMSRWIRSSHLVGAVPETLPAESAALVEPVVVHPVDTEAVDTEAVDTELVGAELVDTELVDAELVNTELVDAELVDAELVDVEPIDVEPVIAEPVDIEPVVVTPPRRPAPAIAGGFFADMEPEFKAATLVRPKPELSAALRVEPNSDDGSAGWGSEESGDSEVLRGVTRSPESRATPPPTALHSTELPTGMVDHVVPVADDELEPSVGHVALLPETASNDWAGGWGEGGDDEIDIEIDVDNDVDNLGVLAETASGESAGSCRDDNDNNVAIEADADGARALAAAPDAEPEPADGDESEWAGGWGDDSDDEIETETEIDDGADDAVRPATASGEWVDGWGEGGDDEIETETEIDDGADDAVRPATASGEWVDGWGEGGDDEIETETEIDNDGADDTALSESEPASHHHDAALPATTSGEWVGDWGDNSDDEIEIDIEIDDDGADDTTLPESEPTAPHQDDATLPESEPASHHHDAALPATTSGEWVGDWGDNSDDEIEIDIEIDVDGADDTTLPESEPTAPHQDDVTLPKSEPTAPHQDNATLPTTATGESAGGWGDDTSEAETDTLSSSPPALASNFDISSLASPSELTGAHVPARRRTPHRTRLGAVRVSSPAAATAFNDFAELAPPPEPTLDTQAANGLRRDLDRPRKKRKKRSTAALQAAQERRALRAQLEMLQNIELASANSPSRMAAVRDKAKAGVKKLFGSFKASSG